MLKSGLVAPLNGAGVFAALEADAGCGLFDQLIADDYRRTELTTRTRPQEGRSPASTPSVAYLRVCARQPHAPDARKATPRKDPKVVAAAAGIKPE